MKQLRIFFSLGRLFVGAALLMATLLGMAPAARATQTVTVLDSGLTGGGATPNATGTTPNTFMGGGFTLGNAAGTSNIPINGFTVYPFNSTGTTYVALRTTVYFWANVNTGTVSTTAPAFSNLITSVTGTSTGTFTSGSFYTLRFTIGTPVIVPTQTVGITVSYQGSTDGTTFATANNLTDIIRTTAAMPAGTSIFNGYYRNANSETNGNFTSTLRSLGLTNQAIAIDLTATVPGPNVTTLAATNVTRTGATLNGTVNPLGLATTAKFQYGTTTAYGTDVPVTLAPDNGTTDQTVSIPVTGLTPGTLYHYRLSATNSSGTNVGADLTFTTVPLPSAIITEFRFHGATGPTDEYVEVRNKQNAPLDISGWSIQTRNATGLQTTTVPANTIIPTFGHFLFTGAGYSLGSYGSNVTPTNGTPTAIATDVPDNSGVALFNAAGTLQDAVGFVASDATLREGAGLPAYPTVNGEYAFMRDFIISQEKDTDNSANDFVFVSTTGTGVAGETAPGTAATVAAQLGAPSPEGLTSPNYFNNQTISTLLDPSVASGVAPNRARITGGGTLGTLIVRRTIKNNTNVPITRLRLSVTSITSLNSAGFGNSAQADVRLVSGGGETGVLLANGTTMVNTEGTTLEAGTGQPQQPLGGGLGSSINFPSVTLGAPLMPGASRNYNFRLQIERGGSYFIALNILALTQ